MACDYQAIRRDNERRYGTDIGRIGRMLLADRYGDRTHFIYELLQNTDDALAKRDRSDKRRSVRFHLGAESLRVSHFGKPFDEADVRGICGIAESTKDLTAIGQFGIGFKSVYAFTDRPEIHSGNESFVIESYVWPAAAAPVQHEPDETVVVLHLRDPSERADIEAGLRQLGPTSLLFLRAIDEIEWSVENGPSGFYLRDEQKEFSEWVRRIAVIGQSTGTPDVEESWLVFSKPVFAPSGREAGCAEIAFSTVEDRKADVVHLRPVPRSPLVVFFPTVLETHLGFLAQGPYRTTPSRDNVPAHDPWNRHCVTETAALLRMALHWLRGNGRLNVAVLRCLPLDRSKFADGAMFTPLFREVRDALSEESLLPRHGGSHVAAKQAALARSQELRDLLNSEQLTRLLGTNTDVAWLDGAISLERTPELRKYLVDELKIDEVRQEAVLSKLTVAFLEAQPNEWVRRLYESLGSQKALLRRARNLPLVRLDNGKHVRAQLNGQPQGFLPGAVPTGFPTVRPAVCDTEASREFLQALGLTEPDLVDDVITHVLPRYVADRVVQDDSTYAGDIERMLRAHSTDSDGRRKRLINALRKAHFVAVRAQHDNSSGRAAPGDVYLATERLIQLFAGVKGVLIVDDTLACLRGEDVRTLLVACGAHRYLEPVPAEANLDCEERKALRLQAGLERKSWESPLVDATLRGLAELLQLMGNLAPRQRNERAILLWDALGDLESRHGSGAFLGTYSWGYSHATKTARFDASFVRLLNKAFWIPDSAGNLHRPSDVVFDSLGWNRKPFLLSKICFKPPVIEQLAREAGIEPGLLDLLKRLGVTSEAELRARMGIEEETQSGGVDRRSSVEYALKDLGLTSTPTPAASDPTAGDPRPVSGDGGRKPGSDAPGVGGRGNTKSGAAGRPFVSYVAAHANAEGPDPDGLDHTARMALEAKAIDLILSREPEWRRTPTHNPGFDLCQGHEESGATRWCEVKAMTGRLAGRSVGLSRRQFDCAAERGAAYWLYIVECAGTDEARLVRIQDPAGKARTFTFDHGWLDVAAVDNEPTGSRD